MTAPRLFTALLIVVDCQGGAREGLYFEKASIFQSSHTHLLGKTKNIPWLTLHAKKLIDALVLQCKHVYF